MTFTSKLPPTPSGTVNSNFSKVGKAEIWAAVEPNLANTTVLLGPRFDPKRVTKDPVHQNKV
jgi:hypothetical protein